MDTPTPSETPETAAPESTPAPTAASAPKSNPAAPSAHQRTNYVWLAWLLTGAVLTRCVDSHIYAGKLETAISMLKPPSAQTAITTPNKQAEETTYEDTYGFSCLGGLYQELNAHDGDRFFGRSDLASFFQKSSNTNDQPQERNLILTYNTDSSFKSAALSLTRERKRNSIGDQDPEINFRAEIKKDANGVMKLFLKKANFGTSVYWGNELNIETFTTPRGYTPEDFMSDKERARIAPLVVFLAQEAYKATGDEALLPFIKLIPLREERKTPLPPPPSRRHG